MVLILFCFLVCSGIFGGFLLGVRSVSGLAFYDWETTELIRRIEIQPKTVRMHLCFFPSSLPPFPPPSLPPSLPSSLPSSLPASCPPSLPASLPSFLPTFLSSSLLPSLPPYFPPSFPSPPYLLTSTLSSSLPS